MTAPFITFDGASFYEIAERNLLQSTEAHLEADAGDWGNQAGLVASTGAVVTARFGTSHAVGTVTGDNAAEAQARINEAGRIPAAPGETYSCAAYLRVPDDGETHEGRVVIRAYESGSNSSLLSVEGSFATLPNDGWLIAKAEGLICPANTFTVGPVLQFRRLGGGRVLDDVYYWDAAVVVEESTLDDFVPTLRLDAVAEDVSNPSGVPVSYTPGATLRLGDAWAGDLVLYERRDGVSGPVVCRLDPSVMLPPPIEGQEA